MHLDRSLHIRRNQRDAQRRRFGSGRYQQMVKDLAAVSLLAFEARAVATLFGLEGVLRHCVRSELCLQGWRWTDANALARLALEDAFAVVGAIRPTWYEGQLEWTVAAGTLIERTRCVKCHAPLPEGHHKFCSENCAATFYQGVHRIKHAQEGRAIRLAIRRV